MSDDPQATLNASWEARWQSGQTGWDRGGPSPALLDWLARGEVPPGRWLVPGCGQGWEVEVLASAGCQVTAVDLAPSALARLRQRLLTRGLSAECIEANLLEWEPAQAFDGIYEQTCLCALHPSSLPAYAERLARWLKPGGVLLALLMQTGREGGPPFDCPLPAMQALFSDSLWQWPAAAPRRIEHPSGLHELAVRLLRRTG